MKQHIIKFGCAAVLGLLFLTGAAFAKVREFKYFTLDVPRGWKVAQKDASVRVRKADKSASMTITFDSRNGRSLKSIADEASRRANGMKPEKDEDGDYTFTCNGGRTQAFLSEAGDYFLMMSVTSTPETENELEAILDSFEMKEMDGDYGDDEDSGYNCEYDDEDSGYNCEYDDEDSGYGCEYDDEDSGYDCEYDDDTPSGYPCSY